MSPPLILASASKIRARLLQQAGVKFMVQPAALDEKNAKIAHRVHGKASADLAPALAGQKALMVAADNMDGWVIGCDQILLHNDMVYDKPEHLSEARAHLQQLRGQPHRLITACCLVQKRHIVWNHVAEAQLTMRRFSDQFLDQYLATAGEDILSAVGCYQLESLGVQLFEQVEGDYFSILGLPLIALLKGLRDNGLLCP